MKHDKLLEIALASPNWRKIGVGKGKFHICRRNHSHGYIEGNVFIGPAEENQRERNQRYRKYPQGTAAERAAASQRAWVTRNPDKKAAKDSDYYKKRKAAAAGKAATASNSTPMNINLGEEHDVEQNKI
jgi:hypothetical protein